MAKARDFYVQKDSFFILSDITKEFMQKHNLPGTVAQFKARVVCTVPYKTVYTGCFNTSTKVYRISDFTQKQMSTADIIQIYSGVATPVPLAGNIPGFCDSLFSPGNMSRFGRLVLW